jgi:multidrug efflux pump
VSAVPSDMPPTMYMLFARARVPGANKTEAKDDAPAHHDGELVAK